MSVTNHSPNPEDSEFDWEALERIFNNLPPVPPEEEEEIDRIIDASFQRAASMQKGIDEEYAGMSPDEVAELNQQLNEAYEQKYGHPPQRN